MSTFSSRFGKVTELSVSWVPASNGYIPPRAVYAGGNVFVGRALHGSEYIPAKVVEGHSTAYVPYDCKEQGKDEYEVLVDCHIGCLPGEGYEWTTASNGSVPKNALLAGTDNGNPLFVARAEFNGEMCVGKVHPEHGCAYMPWGGEENKVFTYDVLCFPNRHI